GRLGRGELLLELLDRIGELTRHVVGARLLLGIVALPVRVLTRPQALLDLAQIVVQAALGVAGEDASDVVPAALDAREERPRLAEVSLVGDGLRLVEESALRGDLLAGCLGIRRLTLAACGIEGVARRLGSRPARGVGHRAGWARGLPLVEELAVLRDAVLALGRQRLGSLDEL